MLSSEEEIKPSPILLKKFHQNIDKFKKHIKKKDIAILIDYDLPIIAFRLWVINTKNDSVLINSRVSHAYNSGLLYAEKFSNTPDTEKSCTGAFVTAETYEGAYGYSMKLKGLEKGINDNAYDRYIVFHPNAALWSLGCFMTDEETNRKIIGLTHDGAFLFVNKSNPVYSDQ